MSRSVLKAFKILELIAESDKNLTVTEISRQLTLPKSSTHNILQILLQEGYILMKDNRSKTYELGLGVFKILKLL